MGGGEAREGQAWGMVVKATTRCVVTGGPSLGSPGHGGKEDDLDET